MVALVSRIGARLFANVHVEGLEHIPRKGAVILAINHISNVDPFVTGAWITPSLRTRRVHWLGKKELFELAGVRVAGGPRRRSPRGPRDRRHRGVPAATRILEAGYVLLVFPEGTRSPNGELQEAKDGLAMLALRTNAVDRADRRQRQRPRVAQGPQAAAARSRDGRSRSASGHRSASRTSSRRAPTGRRRRPSPRPRSWAASPPSSTRAIAASTPQPSPTPPDPSTGKT